MNTRIKNSSVRLVEVTPCFTEFYVDLNAANRFANSSFSDTDCALVPTVVPPASGIYDKILIEILLVLVREQKIK